jgi:hypothetical protein
MSLTILDKHCKVRSLLLVDNTDDKVNFVGKINTKLLKEKVLLPVSLTPVSGYKVVSYILRNDANDQGETDSCKNLI